MHIFYNFKTSENSRFALKVCFEGSVSQISNWVLVFILCYVEKNILKIIQKLPVF